MLCLVVTIVWAEKDAARTRHKKEKNYGLWLPDYTILLLQSLKYIFKNWVWICLDSIFDRFCWDFRWFHKHRCWPWTLQFYFWNILDAGLEPSWFYFWNLLILFLQTPQLDDWWYWWFSLCATCGVELPWFHFCILGVSSLGALDFILFFRGSTPSGCTTRGCFEQFYFLRLYCKARKALQARVAVLAWSHNLLLMPWLHLIIATSHCKS